MNGLKIFDSQQFGSVRTTAKDGEVLFCLLDVCRILEIENPRNVKARLDNDSVHTMDTVDTAGKRHEMTFVDEAGLYKTIFQSRKPEAEAFSKWVTKEVIPSIRKHGLYAKEELLDNPDLLVEVALKLKAEREARKALEAQAAIDAPKVLFADAVSTSDTCILIGELAKILKGNGINIGQNRLFDWLRNNGYLIKRNGTDYNMPTQKAMELGLFKLIESTVTKPDGNVIITKTTKVTGKGQQYFINAFLNLTEKTEEDK